MRTKSVILLMAMLILSPLAFAQGSVEDILAKGKKYYGKEKFDKAEECFLPLAEQGNATAQYYLGECYMRYDWYNGDVEQGTYWLRKAAHQGCADAQLALGRMLCYDVGTYWLQQAANAGNKEAQCLLGERYDEGVGFPVNSTMAVYWWEKVLQTKMWNLK